MSTYIDNHLETGEILYGQCCVCKKSFPIDDLAVAPAVEAFYRTFLLKIEKGEFPQLLDDDYLEGIFCKDCKPF